MRVVKTSLDESAANEAYCLIMAYLREEKIGATYNKECLQDFVHFLHDILKDPNNFQPVEVEEV